MKISIIFGSLRTTRVKRRQSSRLTVISLRKKKNIMTYAKNTIKSECIRNIFTLENELFILLKN